MSTANKQYIYVLGPTQYYMLFMYCLIMLFAKRLRVLKIEAGICTCFKAIITIRFVITAVEFNGRIRISGHIIGSLFKILTNIKLWF